ncbi:endonuclease-reverse transcriptase [Trichonephila clavipes]|nr:endonuclease-reverse transcriptase [Trichonephila clavipes]
MYAAGLKYKNICLSPSLQKEACAKETRVPACSSIWLYKEPQVTQVVRSNGLRWLGHIWRSPENNQTRAYTFKNPMGSRTRGRPPTRWIDDVENDLKTLNILKTG